METKHGDILLYESTGLPILQVRMERETVWRIVEHLLE